MEISAFRKLFLSAFAIGSVLLNADHAFSEDNINDKKLLQIFASRLEALTNVTIDATETEEVTPPKGDRPPIDLPPGVILGEPEHGRFDSLLRLVRTDKDHFVMLQKYSRETIDRVTKESECAEEEKTAIVGLGDKFTCVTFMSDGRHGEYSESLSNLMIFKTIDLALGMRLLGEEAWLDKTRLEAATVTHKNGMDIVTITGKDTVAYWMAFDPANNYALVWVGLGVDGYLNSEYVCSDFTVIKGVPIPNKIDCYSYYQLKGVFGVSRTQHLKVTKCTVGENKPDVIDEIHKDTLAGKFPELK